jgi:riboflavin synthase
MFTGIIQTIGKVVKYDGKSPPHNGRASAEPCGGRLWIAAPFKKVERGESISVEGVCLTVAAKKGGRLLFDVGKETQRITTLGKLAEGSGVNLERALRVGDRLGGHYVSGHVEETGQILKIEKARQNWWFTFQLPRAVKKYVVAKGSLAIDGISLTVAAVRGGKARVMIIPHTLTHTTLRQKGVGDRVNMEPDLLAKYLRHGLLE